MLSRISRTYTIPEINGFPINEHWDVLLIEHDELTTCEESLNSSEYDKGLIAMKSEMDSMYENYVWNLVNLPKRIKPIGCK